MKGRDFELGLESKGFDFQDVHIHRFHAVERMGQLYEVQLEVVALAGKGLDPDEIIGADALVTITADRALQRRIHGLITHVHELSEHGTDQSACRLTIHPLLWQSTLVETLDIHLDSTVPDVLRHKLSLFNLAEGTDFLLSLDDSYPMRELVVQYQETDLAFLSRLCEHLGIFFYFAQEEEQALLVLGDSGHAYRPIADDPGVPFRQRGEATGVYELRLDRSLIPGVYVCRDYNDQTPSLELQAQHELEEGFAGAVIEYGGDFLNPDHGQRLARVRAEEHLAGLRVFSGRSDEPRFAPGHTFRLEGHGRHEQNLLLLTVEHEASQHVAGWGEGTEKSYSNKFTAIPAGLTYRPARETPIPRIHGVVSGVIETWQGELGRFAKIDNHGRYTVRFLYDTAGPDERKASCPVRMMQPSAGPSYGVHFPLKPGVEVLIGFVGGNPDRPIILGAVPNPITPTPVAHAESTKSRIKTRSGIIIEFEDAGRGS